MTAEATLDIIGRLVSFALVLQTLELIQIRNVFARGAIWVTPFMTPVLTTRLALAGAGMFVPHVAIWLALLASTHFICARFRGTFNGGSDYMTVLILACLSVGTAFAHHPRVQAGAIWYLAVQTCLSYFIAGWVKIRNPEWRTGRALTLIFQLPTFDVPTRVRAMTSARPFAVSSSWLVIAFELAFPLALLHPWACVAFMASGLTFHLFNAYAIGLNRFVFAWTASYPALLYCSLAFA